VNNTIRWATKLLLLGLVIGLPGCIQPDATPTATFSPGVVNPPAVVSSPPPAMIPPTAAPIGDVALVTQLIYARGDTPANLVVWYDSPLGPDRLQAFSYTNQNGAKCAGFLLLAFPGGIRQPQNDNGAKGCEAQTGQNALVGSSVIVTSDGQPHTIVVGRVVDPAVTALAAQFSDGTTETANPIDGGFLMVKAGLAQVINVTAIDILSNTVILSLPVVPVG